MPFSKSPVANDEETALREVEAEDLDEKSGIHDGFRNAAPAMRRVPKIFLRMSATFQFLA
jgi:hypothetical protein